MSPDDMNPRDRRVAAMVWISVIGGITIYFIMLFEFLEKCGILRCR